MLTKGTFLIFYIIISRLFELVYSNRNTSRLLKIGGVEYFSFHYRFLVLFHIFFVLYFLLKSFDTDHLDNKYLIIFIFIQLIRFKVIFDLGKFWTTRIIVLKNVPMVKSGIYKYLKHPNYLIVFFEVFLVCLIFNDYNALIYFSLVNLCLLLIRIYFEDKANKKRREGMKS